MPTRKQRRRELKAKRHEYEFVYVDAEGNELDEPPPELLEAEKKKEERTNGAKPAAAAAKKQPQRGSRREPQPPSWNRAAKRGGLLGLVVFALFALTSKGSYVRVLPLAVLYTILFVPFTYYIDRYAYKRYEARRASERGATPQRSKKKS